MTAQVYASLRFNHHSHNFLVSKPHPDKSECMVRRRDASEKRTMAVGLRQCIRPLVESLTPGHDGYPLALVPIMWTVW
jgi:hypothetical protein